MGKIKCVESIYLKLLNLNKDYFLKFHISLAFPVLFFVRFLPFYPFLHRHGAKNENKNAFD